MNSHKNAKARCAMTGKRLQAAFFRRLGPNIQAFRDALEMSTDVCMNMKDMKGRIMALNHRNCEVCNILRESDALGLTSEDLFPEAKAKVYMKLDAEARAGQTIIGRITPTPADDSPNFLVSNLYPLRDVDGNIVGTLHVYRLSQKIGGEKKRFPRLKSVAEHIVAHYNDRLRIRDLAKLSGLSESIFKRNFTNTFGMPPGNFIQITRLNAARRLLETTDKLLTDIAVETGFFDQSHMTRVFKKERGITPGEYRRQHDECNS